MRGLVKDSLVMMVKIKMQRRERRENEKIEIKIMKDSLKIMGKIKMQRREREEKTRK